MKYTLVFIIIIFNLILSAEILWEVDHGTFGATHLEMKPTIAFFEDDSFAIVALLEWTDPYGPYHDIWSLLAKFDHNGMLQWSVENINDQSLVGPIETDGGCIISAIFNYDGHYTVIKRDNLGEILWELNMPDFSNIKNIIRLNNFEFVVVGKNQTNISTMRKIDAQGNIIWTRSFDMGESPSYIYNGIPTSDNCIASLGRLLPYDTFVLKVDAGGDSLWSQFNQDNYNNWLFESSTNELIVLSSNEIIKYNLSGNMQQTYDGNFDYGIDLPTDYNFLARNDEFGSPYCRNIFQFDYDLNNIWLTDEYISYYFYKLPDGGYLFVRGFHFIRTNEEIVESSNGIINQTAILFSNYPNPFNPSTTIEFSIQDDSEVEISILNIKGQNIKTLTNNDFATGTHLIIWDGVDESNKPVSSGVYYYKLNINGKTEAVKKCLLLK